jgi:hypothetical protein
MCLLKTLSHRSLLSIDWSIKIRYLFSLHYNDIVYSHSIVMSWKEKTVKRFERLAWKTIYRVIYLTTFPLAQNM